MKKISMTLLSVIFAAFLVGCGSTESEQSDSDTDEATTDETTIEDSESGSNIGGVLKVALNDDPTTLDPYVYSTTNDMNLHRAVFNSLYNYSLDNVELIPELVMAEISEDGLIYELNLQQDVVFHNGKPMTADDVKHSIEMAMKPEASRTASQLEGIKNIEVIDDLTVELELENKDNALLDAFVEIHVTPNDDSIDHSTHPIGTGPFKFVNWERNNKIDLEKFEDYWKDGLPYLDGIEFKSIPDDSVKLMQLQGGQVDFIDIISTSSIESVQQEGELIIPEVTEEGNLASHLMLINNSKEPFNDMEFRQAINYSLNREAIRESLFNNFVVRSSPIPSNLPDYNENIPTYEFDLETAEQLLEESNYEGQKVEVLYHKIDLMYEIVAKITEQNLQSVGINAELKGVPIAEWVENVFNQKEFDIALTGIIPKPDVVDLLNHPFGKINGESIQWDNQGWFEKLNKMKQASPEEAEQLIQELQMEVMTESPAIIIGGLVSPPAMSPNVKGFVMHPQNLLFFEKVSLDE